MSVDAARCPLCGGDNACAREILPQAPVCWCQTMHFSGELLAQVPQAARRRACICARCCALAGSIAPGAVNPTPPR